MIYEFPENLALGQEVNYQGSRWTITEMYVTGDYAGDWGMLVLQGKASFSTIHVSVYEVMQEN